MDKFIFAIVLAHFIQTLQATLSEEVRRNIKESDFAHKKIIPIGKIRSSISKGGHVSPYVKQESECFDSVSQDEQRNQQDARSIENLYEYIGQLGTLDCFILVNNFQGINIPPLNYPIVLRFPKLVALPTSLRGIFDIEIFWVPHHLYPRNSSRSTRGIIKRHCKLSKFLATFWGKYDTFSELHNYCLRIIQHLFAFSSKPWNCEAQFGLYPLMKLHEASCGLQYYPRIFNYHFGSNLNIDYMLSYSKPTINIIISHELAASELKTLQGLMVAIFRRRSGDDGLGGPFAYQSVFLHGIVVETAPNKVTGEVQVLLKYVTLVRVSYENALRRQAEEYPLLVQHTKEYFKPDSISASIRFTSSPSPEKMLVWYVRGLQCITSSHRSLGTPEEMVIARRNAAWLSILKNYTFQMNDRICCTNGVTHNHKLPDSRGVWGMYLGWQIHDRMVDPQKPMVQKYTDTFKSLGFISCTSLAHEALMFEELLSIYDRWIWALLICSMILLAATLSYLGRGGSFLKNILALFKVVVGQSDPFMRRVLKSVPLRSAAVTFLFMGTILSEGYKNENMYHIISPRKVITQENFKQLIEGKFTVYTRSEKITFLLDIELAIPDLPFIEHNNHFIHASSAHAISEVYRLTKNKALLHRVTLHPLLLPVMRQLVMEHKHWYVHYAFKKFFKEEFKKGNDSFHPSPLFWLSGGTFLNHENFTESQMRRLDEIIEKYLAADEQRYSVAKARSLELAKIVTEWEERTLFNFLLNCTSAALVLPGHLSVEYATRLQVTEDHHISVGREEVSLQIIGVSMSGLIPPVFIRRVKWIETSGIWDWHSAVVRKRNVFGAVLSRSKPAKATMSGNVSIIFLILPFGFATAIIGLFCEKIAFHLAKVSMTPGSPIKGGGVNISFAVSTMLTKIANIIVLYAGILNVVSRRQLLYSLKPEPS